MTDERIKIEPTTVSREELHRLVWETPMVRLGERFGISGNGLAKICRRLDIPYPPRGHWAKKAAGHKVITVPLPAAQSNTPASVRISPTEPDGLVDPNSPVQQALDDARRKTAPLHVPERLNRPHAIIAGWLADHERRKQEAKRERDPWRRDFMRPAELSEQDRRRHRILDALFKELERQGARIIQGDYRALSAEVAGEKIEFELREKQKQIRRLLTEKEREREPWNKKGVKQELQPSGFLVFVIKTYLVESLRRERVAQELKAAGRTTSGVTQGLRELRDFYDLGDDCLWVTFADGHLWWAFAQAEVLPNADDSADGPRRFRRTVDGWHRHSLTGDLLAVR